jgi:hypothetical protein
VWRATRARGTASRTAGERGEAKPHHYRRYCSFVLLLAPSLRAYFFFFCTFVWCALRPAQQWCVELYSLTLPIKRTRATRLKGITERHSPKRISAVLISRHTCLRHLPGCSARTTRSPVHDVLVHPLFEAAIRTRYACALSCFVVITRPLVVAREVDFLLHPFFF